MKYDYETMMRKAFAADKVPDPEFSKEILWEKADGEKRKSAVFGKIAFSGCRAAVVLFLCLAAIGIGMAGVKGSPLRQWFVSGGGNKRKSLETGNYSASILTYEVGETIPHLTIRPEKFVSAGSSSYVILEIRGDDTVRLSKEMYFEEFNLWTEELENVCEDLSETVLEEDRKNNALHLAVTNHTYFSGDKDKVKWFISLTNLMDSEENRKIVLEGTYSVTMEVGAVNLPAKVVKDVRFGKGGSMKITPAGMEIEFHLPDLQCEEIMDFYKDEKAKDSFAELKDGSRIFCDVQGNTVEIVDEEEKDGEAVCIVRLSFLEPVSLDEVKQVYAGSLGQIEVE